MANLFRAYAPHVAGKVAFQKVDKTATLASAISLVLAGEGKNLDHVTLNAPITLTLTSAAEAPLKADVNRPIPLTLTSAVGVVRTSTADNPIVITSTATARHDITATLNRSIAMTSASDVRVTIYGLASNTLNFLNNVTLAGQGNVQPTKGLFNKSLALTLTANAYTRTVKLNAPITLTLTAATTQKATMNAAVTVPLSTVLATTALPISVGVANLICLSPIVDATLNTGQIITGNITAPISIVSGITGHYGAVQPVLPLVNGSGLIGRVGAGAVRSPHAQVTGFMENPAYITGAVSIIEPTLVEGQVLTGSLITGAVRARISEVRAVGLTGTIGAGAVVAPLPNIAINYSAEILMNGSVFAPLPTVQSFAFSPVTGFTTWVMNSENTRITNYVQFPFIALGKLGSSPIGAAADGIYLLEGADDNGTPIASTLQFGLADFRNELAGAVDAYAGGDMAANMELNITEDGQGTEYTYPLVERERHVRGHHAKLGRGFRSRYRQLSLTNVNGGDFTLDSFSLLSKDLKETV